MHFEERERRILAAIGPSGFITYRSLEKLIPASPASIRRDLSRLESAGMIARVRGGAKLVDSDAANALTSSALKLSGSSFEQSIDQNREQKAVIGQAAAALCHSGEGIMLDGGTTTFQMCPHLDQLGLQVLTNSLHIVSALLQQKDTRILVPAGSVFREQNIILAPAGADSMPRFYAPKLFMGAASVGPGGIMQADILLVAAERQFIDKAEEVIVLVDSSKFASSSGSVVCKLEEVDVLITDAGVSTDNVEMLKRAGVKVIIAN